MHACMQDRETLRHGPGSSDRLPFELAGEEGRPARRGSSRRSRAVQGDPQGSRARSLFRGPFPPPEPVQGAPGRLHGPAVAIHGDPIPIHTGPHRSRPAQAPSQRVQGDPGRSGAGKTPSQLFHAPQPSQTRLGWVQASPITAGGDPGRSRPIQGRLLGLAAASARLPPAFVPAAAP